MKQNQDKGVLFSYLVELYFDVWLDQNKAFLIAHKIREESEKVYQKLSKNIRENKESKDLIKMFRDLELQIYLKDSEEAQKLITNIFKTRTFKVKEYNKAVKRIIRKYIQKRKKISNNTDIAIMYILKACFEN